MASPNRLISTTVIMTTTMLLLNLILLAHYTGVVEAMKQQLRSYNDVVETSEKDKLMLDHRGGIGRDLQWDSTPPPNDVCEKATIIPSSFPGPAFTTNISNMQGARFEFNTPKIVCGNLNYNFPNVWYKFTPLVNETFDFINELDTSHFGVFLAGGFGTNATCRNMTQIRCQAEGKRLIDVQLTANRTYFIQVQSHEDRSSLFYEVQLTVVPHRPPFNNQCTSASIIDPTIPSFVSIDTMFALSINNTGLLCGTNNVSRSHWYKFTNALTTPTSIKFTTDIYSSYHIAIFKGNTCGNLQCANEKPQRLDYNPYTFVAESLTTYYMVLQLFSYHPGARKFALYFDSTANFFDLIDPVADVALSRLKDITYARYGDVAISSRSGASTSSLNIQAYFDLPADSMKSVRVTFDNPKRNFCERKAPYSVFGDSNGDFKNATIPIGIRTVTATPFAQSNCTGNAGETMTQSFHVTGCEQHYFIFKGGNDITLPFYEVRPIVALPCKANIALEAFCGLRFDSIRIELRNGTTNDLIHSATPVAETLYRNRAYNLLFDSKPNGLKDPDVLTGSLKAGSYTITSIINNVVHPSFNFTILSTTCNV